MSRKNYIFPGKYVIRSFGKVGSNEGSDWYIRLAQNRTKFIFSELFLTY